MNTCLRPLAKLVFSVSLLCYYFAQAKSIYEWKNLFYYGAKKATHRGVSLFILLLIEKLVHKVRAAIGTVALPVHKRDSDILMLVYSVVGELEIAPDIEI